MNRKLRRGLIVVLLAIFVISGGLVVWQLVQYRQGEETYEEAAQLAGVPVLPRLTEQTDSSAEEETADETPAETPEETPEETQQSAPVDRYAELLNTMDFTALQEINPDVKGWIIIPDTSLSYPLMQGTDNAYYLTHTYRKAYSSVGAIFMDYRCSAALGDFNTIIYGHRMNNDSMFATLKYYKQQSFWSDHPTIYITTSQGTFAYTVFAAYETSATSESYRLTFSSPEKKQAYLDMVCGWSVIETGVTPTPDDYILTLSTCTTSSHDSRMLVQAYRQGTAGE